MFLLCSYNAHTLLMGMKAKAKKLHPQRWEELRGGEREGARL